MKERVYREIYSTNCHLVTVQTLCLTIGNNTDTYKGRMVLKPNILTSSRKFFFFNGRSSICIVFGTMRSTLLGRCFQVQNPSVLSTTEVGNKVF